MWASERARLRSCWHRYWFGLDGRLAIGVARIGIAVSALMMWNRVALRDYGALLDRMPARSYQPVGLLRLLGADTPSALMFEVCKVVAVIAIACMLVGLLSRASTIVSLLSMLVVVGARESFGPYWSHGFNAPLTAHLAFALAPAGASLSVDAAVRRWSARWPGWSARLLATRGGRFARRCLAALAGPSEGGVSAWPALLVQLAIALTFFNAAYWKLLHGVGGAPDLAWVFSDNLRHQLVAGFDWAGRERTAAADWLLQSEWRYKGAAAANLIAQMLPVTACVAVRRPLLRAALGSMFVVETIALDVVMGLDNYQWLPLAVVFVDWDRLARSLRRTPSEAPGSRAARSRAVPWSISAFIGVFLLANLVISFGSPRRDRKWNTFPLSQFRMFSTVRAKRPYSVHQTWEFFAMRFELGGDCPVPRGIIASYDNRFRKFHTSRDPAVVRRVLQRVLNRSRRFAAHTATARLLVMQVPAYPAPAELRPFELGILGSLNHGRFRSMLGRAGRDWDTGEFWLEPAPVGFDAVPTLEIGYHLDGDPSWRVLPVRRRGQRYIYQPELAGHYVLVARAGDEHYVVAEARHAGRRE